MNTDDLIASLAHDVQPVGRHGPGRWLAAGMMAGALGTLALVGVGLGFRSDLGVAIHGAAFWMKGIYTASLGLAALAATARLARPDPGRMGWVWIMVLPVLGLAVVGAVQMAATLPGQWLAMWLGHSWRMCSALVLVLSVPIFGGLLWFFRRMAPTRLRAAGAMAGLTAGAWSATLYGLHCPEVSAIFVLTWYTLGMGLAAGAGAVLGPRLLRW